MGTVNDRDLLAVLDESLAEALRRAGPHLACKLGCTECCLGPFPIHALDARRLLEGLARLSSERAARVRARAREAWKLMQEDWRELPDEEFYERHASVPCPALDPETGGCELYAQRPVSCRSYGPPVRIGSEDLPPCRLCFGSAAPEEVERARVVIDPQGIEDRLLAELGDDEETLIAAVLAGAP